jgi:hypothetical protein
MNKALLSKLMAREDLEVVEGNFKTASFDPVNRVVRLPILKEKYNEAATLFIGHEIGHALYTPDFFSHEEKKAELADIPFDIINIVEDVRIERKVREFYPGLVNDFLKGYKKLMTEDFFSIKDKDLNTLKYLDRLNLKSKLNTLVDIDFSFKETLMSEKVNAVQTFEDTIAVSREVMAFIKEQQQEEEEQLQEQVSSSGEQDSEEQEESNEEQPEEQTTDNEEQTSVSAQQEEDANDDTSTNGLGEEELEEEELEEDIDDTDYTSDTDRSMRANESKLVHLDENTTLIRVTRDQIYNEFIYSDKDLEKSAEIVRDKYSGWHDFDEVKLRFEGEYTSFVKDVKPAVNAMVQQFELRKSAMESKKIRESTSGSIDVNKLWQYKLDDHIFKSVMTVPDAKNHGLLMYIDYSSSMSHRLYETLKQSVILSMFAKRVGIPFELYGFTTNARMYRDVYNPDSDKSDSNKNDYKDWAVKLVKIADSKWSKSKMHTMFERAMFSGWCGENRYPFIEPAFQLGGTPLNETISLAHIMAADFVKRNRTEKMNVVFLTDGDAQDMRLSSKLDQWNNNIVWDIEGQTKIELTEEHNRYVYSDQRRMQAKKILLSSLSKKYNVIGFFLTDRRKSVGSNGYVVYSNYGGYDSFITVHDKRLQALDDEFVASADSDANISTEATDRKRMNSIKRDFKKFQKNKKMNKLIAQEFAKLVA